MKRNGQLSTSPCKAACPAGIDVPHYIRYIKAGKFDQALGVVRDKIPFPAVCGYACVHPCETKCARGQYDEPVAIRMLKRAAVDHSQDRGAMLPLPPATNKKVAVIGAGPCGLTAAYYLAGFGHKVSVMEALPEPGGMLRYGIPEYRLPNEVLDKDISQITGRGVEIITNTRITSPEDLLKNGFNAVLLASGAWKGLEMQLEGVGKARVFNGISFLKAVNTGNYPTMGQKVIVVGGGNTAIDAARSAVRLGADVTIVYRRTVLEMPANREEINEAIEEGVEIEWLTTPVRFAENCLVCQRMTLGPVDDSGRSKPIALEDSEFSMHCDTLIVAIGQAVDHQSLNLETQAGGTIRIEPETFATSKQAVFAAGDAVSGPSSIIEAIAQGRLVSKSIDRFLDGNGQIAALARPENITDMEQIPFPGQMRSLVQVSNVAERINGFGLVELGYDSGKAVEEAQRCLACDIREFKVDVNFALCKGCGYCREMCSLDIFKSSDSFNSSGYKPVSATDTQKCVGCLKCLYVCPDFAIDIESANC